MNTVFIKQPAGLGDILFCQKIAKTRSGVIWPVCNFYYNTLKKHIDDVNFVNIESDFENKNIYINAPRAAVTKTENITVIATDGCSNNGEELMKSKYNLLNEDWSDWSNYLSFKRDLENEQKLIDFHNIKEKYILTMDSYGTPPHHVSMCNIQPETDLRNIKIRIIDGFSLFDWCSIIENAEEIHVEGSAIIYIIEKLIIKAQKLEMYSRDNHKHFNGLFKKPWNFNKTRIN